MTRFRDWMSPREYARHRRVSHQAVFKAIRDGRIAFSRGLIDRRAADRDWVENSDPAAAGPGAPRAAGDAEAAGAGVTYNQVRTMAQAYRAKMLRLEYEERAGQTFSAEKVRTMAFEQGRRFRDELTKLPARLAPELAAANTRAECERILAAAVRRILEDLTRAAAPGEEKAG